MREKSGTNLLGDSSSLTFLNTGVSDFVQKSGFSSVDMSQNTNDWGSHVVKLSFEIGDLLHADIH